MGLLAFQDRPASLIITHIMWPRTLIRCAVSSGLQALYIASVLGGQSEGSEGALLWMQFRLMTWDVAWKITAAPRA